MKKNQRSLCLAAIFAMLALLTGCSSTQLESPSSAYAASSTDEVKNSAQIYMFRGGFNGVFSTGITDMASELRQRGVPAQDLSWASSTSALDKIKKAASSNANVRPVVLAGHSLGATSVVGMARALTREGIEVDLVIVFDPLGSTRVPKGVRKLINFKASGSKENPGTFRPGPGFTGDIVNVDIRNLPDLEKSSHWNIVNQKELQRRVIQEIETTYQRYQ
ncbi:MAG: hypothetical protein AAGF25_15180 [Pseudomonadota bacterium]